MIILLIAISTSTFANSKTGKLEIGDKAVLTDVKMEDISGAKISIDDAKKSNGILVLFSCNTCPFAKGYEDRIVAYKIDAKCAKETLSAGQMVCSEKVVCYLTRTTTVGG